MSRKETHVHPQVLDIAREIANARYEEWARDNAFYKKFPEGAGRRAFVRAVAPQFLEVARGILAGMLTADYPENVKAEIYDALCLDRTLIAGRGIVRRVN